MAASTIRKAIGAVKDRTSISLAKVSKSLSPDLDVAIVKATSHEQRASDERHIQGILNLTSRSRGCVRACVRTISRRLGKTRDWIVALKALILVHRLLTEGDPAFAHELRFSSRRGISLLNMSDFRDEAHSRSWDHSAFVRTYADYLNQRLQGLVDSPPLDASLRELNLERLLIRIEELQHMLDRFLACRPTGLAKSSRIVFAALCPIVRESFQLYSDVCEALSVLLDRYFDMDDHADRLKSFDAYANAAKQIDELSAFYFWCKQIELGSYLEYPEVHRIAEKLLGTLQELAMPHIDAQMQDTQQRPPEGHLPQPQADLIDLREEDASAVFSMESSGFENSNLELAVAETSSSLAEQSTASSIQNNEGDPFVASLCVPPPLYVQISDFEKKQRWMIQEQQLWLHYANGGMHDHGGMVVLNSAYYHPNSAVQYGMPTPSAYYYPNA